jgi:hypothetical protein
MVDEFIIGVGQSDDDTPELLKAIDSPKIRLFDSYWDTKKTKGGYILSEKTNEALAKCSGDWCFYLQSDEVVHEKDLSIITKAMEKYLNDERVEGLLFNYLHFYGSYNVLATARNWYRKEVRIVRRSADIRSVGDAQGFRIGSRKPKVKASGGTIYHYGWVKPPQQMGLKNKLISRWYHGNKLDDSFNNFAYRALYGLEYFNGSHPQVMEDLIKSQDWDFTLKWDISNWSPKDFKNLLSDVVEKLTGHRFGEHKNYVLLKR